MRNLYSKTHVKEIKYYRLFENVQKLNLSFCNINSLSFM
jgi:hypothetical protein